MDDANVDLLMDGVMFGAFGTAGQRCTAASRLIVHQKVYDDVVDELVQRAEKLRVGNPIDEKTDMGPVASSGQEKKVLEYIDIGEKEGDQLLTGGTKETGPTDTGEAGTTALEEFTYWKTVYVDYSGRLQKAQIDTEKLAGGRRPAE